MAEQDTWVKLRQVVLAVPDVPAASVEAGREFGLARGFADPMLAEIGMDDESCILGDGSTFLEFVGPLRPDASVRRWLDKDGPGGYALSIQVHDVEPILARASAVGVGIAADVKAYGYRIVQMRPKDLGLLVEFDEIPDPEVWSWDDTPKQLPDAPRIDAVAWIELASPDPSGQAVRWAALFGSAVQSSDGRPRIDIGATPAYFVPGGRPMLSAIGVRPSAAEPWTGGPLVLSGVRFETA